MEEVERDAKLLKRCEEQRKEGAKHWQCNMEVQDLDDKPWRNEELRSLEEGLPRLREDNLEKAARSDKAAIGVGCVGYHPRVPPDLSQETRG